MPPKKRARSGLPAVEFVLCERSVGPVGAAAVSVSELCGEFEQKAGVRLPDALVQLLERSGGTTVRFVRCYARIVDQPGKYVHVTGVAGLHDRDSSLWSSDELIEEWQLPDAQLGKLILLAGDGHEWLALCYKKQPGGGVATEPAVIALSESEGGSGDDEESNNESDDDSAHYKIVNVANTFAEFVQALEFHDNEDGIVVALSSIATPPMPFENVRAELNRLLHVELQPPPADSPAQTTTAVQDVSIGGNAIGEFKLWHAPETVDPSITDIWLVTMLTPSPAECTAAADSFIRIVAPSFLAQVVSQPIPTGNVVCTLEV